MKIRFYSIQDLYDEVKDLPKRYPHLTSIPVKPSLGGVVAGVIKDVEKVVRMQFLEKTYSSEFKGAGKTFYQLTTEQILTLSVMSKDAVYYYSQPYFRCMKVDLKNKAKEIEEMTAEKEKKVRETFKGWTVLKGVYEVE